MTGIEIYLLDEDGAFHVYKQCHDGYYFKDKFLKEGNLFERDVSKIIDDFHNKYFRESDFKLEDHPEGFMFIFSTESLKPKKQIIDDLFKNKNYKGISKIFHHEILPILVNEGSIHDEHDYFCGYDDYTVFIDGKRKEYIIFN